MIPRQPRLTLTDTPMPDTSCFGSALSLHSGRGPTGSVAGARRAQADPISAGQGAAAQHEDHEMNENPPGSDEPLSPERRLLLGGLAAAVGAAAMGDARSEEHTSELQSLMRTSYAAFCLKKKN